MKINFSFFLFLLFLLALQNIYAENISARNIIEGHLSNESVSVNNGVSFNGIEASLLLYDKFGQGISYQLNSSLKSNQKFKIRLKSTVDGLLRVLTKNSDGTQGELPSLYIQRGEEISYPSEDNIVLTLDEKKGQEELILILVPKKIIDKEFLNKNILEGMVGYENNLIEETTVQTSYIVVPENMPIIKRITLIHH